MVAAQDTRHGVCNLCEAICGLTLTVADDRVTGVRGNPADPLSRGHLCPKALALPDLQQDPDRLRRPVRRVSTGSTTGADGSTGGGAGAVRWEEIGWEEALDLVADRLSGIIRRARPGRRRGLPRQPQRAQPRLDDACAGDGQGARHPQRVLRHVGGPAPPPAGRPPDVRPPAAAAGPRPRQHRLLPGARREPDGLQRQPDDRTGPPEPAPRPQGPGRPDGRPRPSSHGDREGRRRAPLRPARHGRVRAAGAAARDPARRARVGRGVRRRAGGGATRRPPVPPGASRRGQRCRRGRPAQDRARSRHGRSGSGLRAARGLGSGVRAGHASGPSRCSTSSPATSTVPVASCSPARSSTSSAVAWSAPATTAGGAAGSAGCPSSPASCRSPRWPRRSSPRAPARSGRCSPWRATRCLSTPDGGRLDAAVAGLDFCAAVDFYVNETTRHAEVILPPTTALERDHYNLVFHALAVRNTARFTPAVLPSAAGRPARLGDLPRDHPADDPAPWHPAAVAPPPGPAGPAAALPDPDAGPAPAHRLAAQLGPELRKAPDGVDLGPLRPSLPERLQTADQRIDLRPAPGAGGPGPAGRRPAAGTRGAAAGRAAAPARLQLLDAQPRPADPRPAAAPAPDAPGRPRRPGGWPTGPWCASPHASAPSRSRSPRPTR